MSTRVASHAPLSQSCESTRAASRHSTGALIVVTPLLLASGGSALAYQVIWLRELSLVLGVTVYAASAVLAAFMSGLAVGSLFAGRVLRRVQSPLRAFGVVEVLVGLSAWCIGRVFDNAGELDAAVAHISGTSFAALTAARFAVTFALLLVPTSLMGLTMPLIGASAVLRASFGSRMSYAYAMNTAGGAAGAALTGFYGIGLVGADATLNAAAALSVAVGITAIALSRREPDLSVPADAGPGRAETWRARSIPVARLAATVAASGAAAMALEILWFRALVQVVTATTYAFTTMLTTVLVGLAVGSLTASLISDVDERDWIGWLRGLYYSAAAAAVSSLILLGSKVVPAAAPAATAVLAMLPATLLMGAAFPIAIRIAAGGGGSAHHVACRIGQLNAASVGGGVLGSLLAAFVLLPTMGVRNSVIASSAGFLAAAIALPRGPGGRRWWVDSVALATAAVLAVNAPDPLDAIVAGRGGTPKPAWRYEGAQATVTVHAESTRRMLFVDGLHQASDDPSMVKVHRTIGHLGMALHPNPRRALVVGLGGGATAGAVGRHGRPELRIVELSDGVRRAAPLFAHISYDVLSHPGTTLRLDDARSYLLTTDERFDVITADIIQPTHAGAGGLYSREYFARVRGRLRPGGLVVQWIGHREETAYKLIARTFLDVFPEATAWMDGTLLVGSVDPLRVSRSAFERQLEDETTRDALRMVELASFEALTASFTAGPASLRCFVGRGPVLTDDRPLVEYFRGLPLDGPPVDLRELKSGLRVLVTP